MELDFATDIAPLRQQYFPMLVGQKAFDRGMAFREQVINPMQDRMLKAQDQMLRMQERDLNFRMANLQFQQLQDKYRMERESENPAFYEQVDAILSSDKPVAERKADLADFTFRSLDTLQYSEKAQRALSAANSRLVALDNLDKTNKQEEERRRAPERGLRNVLAQSILPYDVKLAEQVLSGEASLDAAQTFIHKKKKDIGLSEQFQKQREDLTGYQIQYLKDLTTELRNPDVVKVAGTQEEIMLELGGITDENARRIKQQELRENATKQGKKVEFDAPQRDRFIFSMSSFTNLPEEKLRKKYEGNDLQLYSDLLRETRRQEAKLFGTATESLFSSSREDSIRSKFD